ARFISDPPIAPITPTASKRESNGPFSAGSSKANVPFAISATSGLTQQASPRNETARIASRIWNRISRRLKTGRNTNNNDTTLQNEAHPNTPHFELAPQPLIATDVSPMPTAMYDP